MSPLHILRVFLAAMMLAPSLVSAFVPYTGGPLLVTFDELGTTSAAWTNNSTLPGWYAWEAFEGEVGPGRADRSWGLVSRYGLATGQTNSQGLKNLNVTTGGQDRALGTRTGGNDYVFALILRNDTGATITDIDLGFLGQQWKIVGTSPAAGHRLEFSFGVFATLNTASVNPNTVIPMSTTDAPTAFDSGYSRSAGALDVPLVQFGSSIGGIDGNLPANRTPLSANLKVNWPPSQFLVLRWFDDQVNNGTEALLAIDDLTFNAWGSASGAPSASFVRRMPDVSHVAKNNDPFQGAVGMSSSPLDGNSGGVGNLFGGVGGSEGHTVVFSDGLPSGTLSQIRFDAGGQITLESVRLILADDGTSGNRGIAESKLFTSTDNTFSNRQFVSRILFKGASYSNGYGGGSWVSAESMFPPISARYFILEVERQTTSGPRLVELDANAFPPTIPQLSIHSGIDIRWNSMTGRGYMTQWSADLGTWFDIDGYSGNGTEIIVPFNPAGIGRRFYRIQVY
jgi:hypothetical protein